MALSTKQVSGDQTPSGSPKLSKPPSTRRQQQPPQESVIKCPRCSSTNTKFCYYNNYNKSQPRHFCKSCKRHWTKGGTLRNVPVGGGRKNKRPKSPNTTATATATTTITAPTIGDHGDQQITMSSILYQALTRSSSPITKKEGISNDMVPNIELPILSSFSSAFDLNSSLIPTSYDQSYNSVYDHITTTVNNTTSSSTLWPCPDTSSAVDLPNYNWNWNEIEVLTSADHLNIEWDDNDFKKGVNFDL